MRDRVLWEQYLLGGQFEPGGRNGCSSVVDTSPCLNNGGEKKVCVHALSFGYPEQIIQIQPLLASVVWEFYLEQILSENPAPPPKELESLPLRRPSWLNIQFTASSLRSQMKVYHKLPRESCLNPKVKKYRGILL